VSSLSDLGNTPVSSALTSADVPVPGLLSNVATLKRDSVPTNVNQSNIQPVYEVYASIQGRDLGSVSGQISKIVAELQKQLSPGNSIQVVGQIQSMNNAFWDLGVGLLFAAVFVYLLMVVNYQNFGDPFVVIMALPATFCGILTMLFATGTTLNVPSLMGAIMAVGVASANSILLVTFAREQQLAGKTAFQAAIDAGHTRIRPVLMTAAESGGRCGRPRARNPGSHLSGQSDADRRRAGARHADAADRNRHTESRWRTDARHLLYD
jgi:multidrug efflux pump subunit AcrB